ncbi:MAG: type II toxin-antitoxin system HipA family toxin, partial [Clostridia bacterium]
MKYNGATVGYLATLDGGDIAFQYDIEWLKTGFSISPFSLPLSEKVYINENNKNFDGLFGVFSDSLPDGWGELLMMRMLSRKGVDINKVSPLTKLSLVNSNGLGGLSYEPTQFENKNTDTTDFDNLAKGIVVILNEIDVNFDFDRIYRLGGSSGGARPKAHVRIENEDWIVKFPCKIDSPDIGTEEFQANMLAKRCEINTNEFNLFDSKLCKGYFGAKRFDRENDKRIHMVSLSSLLETTHKLPNLDYMHLFQVIQSICVDKEDIYEAYRRMCFNVLYGNKDDHGKNFAFLYDEKLKGYKLSPAYDITRTPYKIEHE